MKILFNAETRITQDNIPVEFLGIATNITMENGQLRVDSQYPIAEAERMLRAAGFNRLSTGISTIIVQSELPPAQEQALPATGVQASPPPSQPAAERVPIPLTEPIALPEEENPEEDPEEDPEDDEGREDENDEPEEAYSPPDPALFDLSEQELLGCFMQFVPANEAATINIYNQKVREYNRIWGHAINLKRNLDKMMASIDQNEAVKSLKADIDYLNEKCDQIDSVKFDSGHRIVITTKPLATTFQPKYGSRLLGRMRFFIDLRYLYSNTPPSTDFTKAIDIVNLDNNPRTASTNWACGHVHHIVGAEPSICFGGYYQQVFDAFTSRNLAQFVDILMRFVLNPDEGDEWGCRIRLFPQANSETVTANET